MGRPSFLIGSGLVFLSTPPGARSECVVGEWSEWSACSAKERFAGCDYGSTPAGWRYRGASGPLPLNESTAGAARGGASLQGMEAKMLRRLSKQCTGRWDYDYDYYNEAQYEYYY